MFTRPTSLTFLIFPVLVWAALRFWRLGAMVAILLFASIAIPLTESDMGPFSGKRRMTACCSPSSISASRASRRSFSLRS